MERAENGRRPPGEKTGGDFGGIRGDGAGVCWEVVAGDGVALTVEWFTTWGVTGSGSWWFL